MYLHIRNHKTLFFLFGVIFFLVASLTYGFEADIKAVYFSSYNLAIQEIVKEIETATMEILVIDNSLLTTSIAKALVSARKRGASVEVIIDNTKKPSAQSSIGLLMKAKIPVYLDSTHTWVHNNIIIVDKSIVVTGSFNLLKAGLEKNSGNLLIIKSGSLASKYIENWYKHKEHARALKGKF